MLKEKVYRVINNFGIENLNQIYNIDFNYGVRFELGEGCCPFNKRKQIEKYYFKKIKKEIKEIYEYINIEYDILVLQLKICDDFGSSEEIGEEFKKDLLNYTKSINLSCPEEQESMIEKYTESNLDKTIYEEKLHIKTYYFSIVRNNAFINKLFLEITKKDFNGILGDMNTYLIDSMNNTIFNFYDDRGVDIWMKDSNRLKDIRKRFANKKQPRY